jgi:hypothetical protein
MKEESKTTLRTPLIAPGPEPIRIEDTPNPKFGSELNEKTKERLRQIERHARRYF